MTDPIDGKISLQSVASALEGTDQVKDGGAFDAVYADSGAPEVTNDVLVGIVEDVAAEMASGQIANADDAVIEVFSRLAEDKLAEVASPNEQRLLIDDLMTTLLSDPFLVQDVSKMLSQSA